MMDFGDLADWGRVLEQIEETSRSGDIEHHQDDLAMLLRYSGNWRLREAALECIPRLQKPDSKLVREVCRLMLDEDLYFEARILAAEALASAMDRLVDCSEPEAVGLRRDLRKQVHELLDSPDAPVVHQAARRILPRLE